MSNINPIQSLDQIIDQVFNRSVGDIISHDFKGQLPAVNIVEADSSFKIQVAAPGYAKSDFKVHVEKGALIIEAAKSEETKEVNYKKREFKYDSFKRSFKLPDTADNEAISASYELGILNITLKKKNKDTQTVFSVEIK